MRLTAEEQAYTRQVAAQIGRNPDDLIREGEQVKASGWRSAQQQAEGRAQRSAAGGGLGMAPGPYQDPCAGPSVMAAHRDHHPRGRQSKWEAGPG
jgi:hypothetical protein